MDRGISLIGGGLADTLDRESWESLVRRDSNLSSLAC